MDVQRLSSITCLSLSCAHGGCDWEGVGRNSQIQSPLSKGLTLLHAVRHAAAAYQALSQGAYGGHSKRNSHSFDMAALPSVPEVNVQNLATHNSNEVPPSFRCDHVLSLNRCLLPLAALIPLAWLLLYGCCRIVARDPRCPWNSWPERRCSIAGFH